MLNVTDTGSGTPILWIHGFPLASSIFERQLAIGGVRHLMPDLPGFGLSPLEGGRLVRPDDGGRDVRPPSMDDYARLMLDVLDLRGIDRAVIAGFSMGGYIAFALARIAPERMRGLILIDTRETADTEEARKGRYDTIAKVREQGIQPVVDAMRSEERRVGKEGRWG